MAAEEPSSPAMTAEASSRVLIIAGSFKVDRMCVCLSLSVEYEVSLLVKSELVTEEVDKFQRKLRSKGVSRVPARRTEISEIKDEPFCPPAIRFSSCLKSQQLEVLPSYVFLFVSVLLYSLFTMI